ncbi:M20 family metallopeptidase [Salipaludibacillus sp. LMS25]|jgi:amidohydrolase|uniref:M20 family metallopeptidase n=1 Tax=Salipaludibacillus sp. LMS25 TaxID=2924031 RepID=UPI0020D0EB41|nr:M20 family metallopeptidase [Salipaludibacillus sp. LMS25]UTR14228.1 M20 family metallopeptidase [Salipaludibacillus sp. LMS25]
MFNNLYEKLASYYDEMVDIRRYLHQHPELSFQEVKTPQYIAQYHRQLGHDVREGVGGRGVVATLTGEAGKGPTVALRADFDALPIQDLKDVPYKSTVPNVMHACGHDAHTSLLLVLAKALNSIKTGLKGTVVFIHQHAEELAPGGAKPMIDDGCLENVDVIFGTHLWATTPLGTIEYNEGPIMAAADRFEIIVHGKGGHGAQPHMTKDAILIGSQIVQSLQHIVSRRVDPMESAVISIGAFEAKNAFNVIADSARLEGTVRTFDEKIQAQVKENIAEVVHGVADSFGAKADFHYYKGYPAVINHSDKAQFLQQVASQSKNIEQVIHATPQMGGEDFSYYLNHTKGAFFFTGAQHPDWEKTYPHHHPRFDIDERAMLHGATVLGNLVLSTFENRA